MLQLENGRELRVHLKFLHENRSDEYLKMKGYDPQRVRSLPKGYKVGPATIAKAYKKAKSLTQNPLYVNMKAIEKRQ